jgi:hypothetical protein
MTLIKNLCLASVCFFAWLNIFAQDNEDNASCEKPATIILFRTFDFFNFKFSYNLFSGDSLLGRIKTHDVFILETFDQGISFHATTKAPSLNATKRSGYQKKKNIKYPFTLKSGQVYFVKCGFLNQRLFDYPRQPTIRLLKKEELRKYIRKRFLRKKIKAYLYEEWLTEKDIKRYTTKIRQ